MKVTIIGLGLIGGSIGLAIKKYIPETEVVGVPRREETIKLAIAKGAVNDATLNIAKGVENADLVFICTPINLIIPKLKEMLPSLKKGAVVTDVGSTKNWIVSEAEKILPDEIHFIGGHPMAGKEKVKLDAAEADLFQNKTWILCPIGKAPINLIVDFIKRLGARTMEMDPKKHDLAVGAISHLPLAVAASLVNTVADLKEVEKEAKQVAASGFKDTTRVASGDPILGVDMFTTNKEEVLKLIGLMESQLGSLKKAIKAGNTEKIKAELEKAKKFRDGIWPQS